MPLDPEFIADALYEPEGLMIDDVLEIDPIQSLVRLSMPTSAELPITRTQRVREGVHPRHVSGGLIVHMTGVCGFAHFYYVLGLRHADGWTGYGARINSARFHNLALPGPPLILECRATQVRKLPPNIYVRYAFRFTQGDQLIYEGDQTALWSKVA